MVPSRLPPARVGKYKLLLPIGRGGMGQVFLGVYEVAPGVARHVAIKVIHPTLEQAQEQNSALLREARVASRVRHPNVVDVVEAGRFEDGVFLALEYVEGTNLHHILRWAHRNDVALPVPVVARIIVDALDGLHAAHELVEDDGRSAGLVHRDFTPQNILVGIDGVSRLTDFGVAKSHQQTSATATGVVKGKVAYMAPEQALGHPIDRRVDVWSAGVVLWECLTGKRLFRRETDATTLLAIVTPAALPRASTHRPSVPSALDDAIAGAVAHDPQTRVGSAAELCRRIRSAVEPQGCATHEEVAAWVRRVAGEELTARRSALTEAATSSHVRPVATPTDEPETTTRASTSDLLAKRGSRRWLGWALPSLAVMGLAVVGVRAIDDEGSARVTIISRSPTEPSLRAPQPTPDVLRITADAAMAQITVGQRSVLLGAPAREVELPLRADETDRDIVIAIKTVDGRVGTQPLRHGQREVHVKVVGAAPRSVFRPPSKPAPSQQPKSPPVIDPEGLASSPY